jgi:hypothetical protein
VCEGLGVLDYLAPGLGDLGGLGVPDHPVFADEEGGGFDVFEQGGIEGCGGGFDVE